MEHVEKLNIRRYTGDGMEAMEDIVIKEAPITIILNNQELVTLLCSPIDLKNLGVGYLFSEGLLSEKSEIKKVSVDEDKGIVRVDTVSDTQMESDIPFKRLITSGCGRGASLYSLADAQTLAEVKSDMKITPNEVFALVKKFQNMSQIFKETGGVHSAALCNKTEILNFKVDIGRHNAIDKIIGECMLNDISMVDHVILTSGRISSEILLKVLKRNIPILISRSAPTSVGVKLAEDLGITLIGFVRGTRMNVYSHSDRIDQNHG
ncbi:MAG: formate dehydrogenase accessory sulfurtransferase FdhD [Chloroflexi bacterium]|jgi:FdhD protein|nr:formate dehydrogenase accessory sulfurtransferase FdhD [Chloroflexota bacterium]MBT7082027.1 formate dehydrogenase accessory sulfurtransferase FdhD [Chloroflexota bacterium]MBT7289698.1 formate dehydrogenase accessory sulfurtransferase FdhD [Chloroflexota bacterium]